jgi:predicted amidohydrolase/ribosomal protein S18 acetylase RimI-like enzyme
MAEPLPKISVRRLRKRDIPDILAVQRAALPDIEPWDSATYAAQLRRFPEGQLGIFLGERLIATSAALVVHERDWDEPHTFDEVTSTGTFEYHDPDGDVLYGVDIAVHPEFRGMRMARRLYVARKRLARRLNLRGIHIAGRLPGYHQHASKMSPAEYVDAVLGKRLVDDSLTAQLANGFAVRDVLPGYLPSDEESLGNAVLMDWVNPDHIPKGRRQVLPRRARVASVQYQMRQISSWEEFCAQVEFFADTASEYRADFVLYPECLTNQLHPLLPPDRPAVIARRMHEFTDRYLELFRRMAIKHAVNIIAGTHLTLEDDSLYNVAYLFRRDGSMESQRKIHITPAERRWWGVSPGDVINVFDTDAGRVAVLICYDVEFPELARVVAAQGAQILFVPYNTEMRQGHLRVRSCAQARCIENNVYCVLSGATGNLPFASGADIHYAQSCILTPSDLPFDRDGIAAEATPNVETLLMHDLDLDILRRQSLGGTVRPFTDRRTDLYSVVYRSGKKKIVV